jgi:type II secretory ATPase GspE/PulE/Tfp pilus assembly ATPase PilB-like protein
MDTITALAELTEASDIHIEPNEEETLIRFRIDGLLRRMSRYPRSHHASLIARIKVLANLRIDERRIPQDGRFSADAGGQLLDFRVSTVPSAWGEKAVLRVLRKEAGFVDLANLGMLETDLEIVRRYLRRPYGMILVCGPTGSGKSTSLYAFLQEIGSERIEVLNISTVEDPIEYAIPCVTQMSIQPEIDFTFAAGLRSLLRQDPDIIMVGEIRDRETADIAVRASLTGRLLLSSLHTNDAVGTVPRLLDMGIESFLVSSTLTLVIAQRLVRKLCTLCRRSYEPTGETLKLVSERFDARATSILARIGVLPQGPDPMRGVRLFRAAGCPQCGHSGYQGRTAVFEILEVDDAFREAIRERRDTLTIRRMAIDRGMKPLAVDGLAKVVLGITDLDEVIRSTV